MSTLFASTLPKPHEPTHRPKLCQRACKANARKIVFKKKIMPARKWHIWLCPTHKPTPRKAKRATF